MKKILITLTITLIAINVNAQWFMGGGTGLNIKDTKTTTDKIIETYETTIGFSVAPKGGYYFNEKLALGLSFAVGANFVNAEPSRTSIIKDQSTSVRWRINPFIRYSIFTYKKFSIILEGSVGVGEEYVKYARMYNDGSNIEGKQLSIGIGVLNVAPILGYKLSDHFQLEAGLYFLNLGYNIDIITDKLTSKPGIINHDFNIGFNSSSILSVSGLTIGAIYKF